MKKILFSVLAALAVMSCSKNEEGVAAQQQTGEKVNVRVEVNAPVPMTKMTGKFEQNEGKVNNYQIFVFDKASGVLESYGYAESGTYNMGITTGIKHIYALVNAPDLSYLSNESQFLGSMSKLDENAFDNFVMMSPSGDLAEKVITTDCTITLSVKRFAAKILIDRITAAFKTAALQAEDFVIRNLYIDDAAGDAPYGLGGNPTLYYSGSSDNGETINDFIREPNLNYNLKNNGYSNVRHGFYVYPNPSDTKTKIVIETTILSAEHIYSFELPKIERNKVYDITDIKITRLSGDIAAVDFSITVDDWDATVTDSYVY